MKYTLKRDVPGPVPAIGLTEPEYLSLKQARKVLNECFLVEEKYELLVFSYVEFEKQIHDATAEHMVRSGLGYAELFGVRIGLNSRLVSFLTSARQYLDSLFPHVRECLEEPDTEDLVSTLRNREYDSSPEYRFMEALRNHVQHRDLPIHSTSSGSSWTTLGQDGLLEYTVSLQSSRSRLLADGKFSSRVLEEMPETVDLKIYVRRYMESISTIHSEARNLIRKSVDQARRIFEEAHRRYGVLDQKQERIGGLVAFKWDATGCVETVDLVLEWDDIRQTLQTRNGKLTNLGKRYVSTE